MPARISLSRSRPGTQARVLPMARSDEDMLHEIETANNGEGPDPIRSYDGELFRAIADAVEAGDATRDAVGAAVAQAREAGASWTAIGAMLGVTRQAAIRRYSAACDS